MRLIMQQYFHFLVVVTFQGADLWVERKTQIWYVVSYSSYVRQGNLLDLYHVNYCKR